ncbi:MAG: class IV adenylate cyclase [Candidatus Pacearchaeota archaeon]
MIETEAKIRLSSEEFNDLYLRLGRPDFVLQKNWGYVSMNNIVRIREEGDRRQVTLKLSNQASGEYNSREELEIGVSDIALTRRIFETIGLQNKYHYEKKRATKQISDCTVCLDCIVGLGEFIEVEGAAGNIKVVLESFGLSSKPIERRSYFELLNGMH